MSEGNQTEKPDTVQIEDLNQFIFLLSNWHKDKVALLKHLMEMPEGLEVTLDDTEVAILKGDLHKGFKIGLIAALSELGELPFVAELIPDESESPDESTPTH